MTAAAQLDLKSHRQPRARFSAEFELLCACCEPLSDLDRLAQTLDSPIDWDVFLRLAQHHRVLPAIHGALCGRTDVPGSIQSALRSRFQSNAVKALRFSAELARVTRAFADSGIEVLAHKGPALGQFLYGDAAMRQFGDLDLLVRPADVARAKAVLRQLGYRLQLQLSPRQERAYLQSGYEYVFALGDQRNLLELQWRILPRFYAIEFDLEAMFQRSVEVTIEGHDVRSLGCDDLMLVLCVHAAKHGWAQLGMLQDIARLVGFGLDWSWVEAEARRLGVHRILSISLWLAQSFLACPPPSTGSVDGIQGAEKLVEALQLRLAMGNEVDTQSVGYFREFVHTRERWQDRARLASRLALTPSVSEWESVRMPDAMFPLYRVVRIGRLVKRAIV
jgi:Uncharacterised nucleotidyltransferase